MTYATAALARVGSGWSGDELPLDDVEDLDGVVELLLESAGDDARTALLFVEEDDEWFAVLRVDEGGDPRVFISDARVILTSQTAGLFGEAAIEVAPPVDTADDEDEGDDEDEDDAPSVDGEPAGDAGLLADLGTPAPRLLALCAEEGALPGDVISDVCEAAGCLDVLEKIRGQ